LSFRFSKFNVASFRFSKNKKNWNFQPIPHTASFSLI